MGFGVLWFYVMLAPESGLIKLPDVINEHRLYLPSAGLIAAFVATIVLASPAAWIRVAYALFISALLALSGATFARNEIWRDERRFWSDELRKSPHKARVIYNAGFLEKKLGHYSAAEVLFARAIAENPRQVPALLNLAALARQRGDLTAALGYYERAYEIEPWHWQILLDIRNLFIAQGRVDEAARQWNEAVRQAGSEERAREELRRAGSAATLPETVLEP